MPALTTSTLRDTEPLTDDPTKDTAFSKIDGENRSRHFDVRPGATLRLRFVALVNGRAGQGGAIRNAGTLTTERVIFADNRGAQGGVVGGALYNTGTYLGTDTVFAHNSAGGLNPAGWRDCEYRHHGYQTQLDCI